jgi:hypothetical protein
VAPLWDNNNEVPANNNDQDYSNKPPFLSSKDVANGNKVVIEHFSNEKCTQVRIDATVAKQLLKDLIVDPLSYADFDDIPPITPAQLDFLVARINSVVPLPPLEEISRTPGKSPSSKYSYVRTHNKHQVECTCSLQVPVVETTRLLC